MQIVVIYHTVLLLMTRERNNSKNPMILLLHLRKDLIIETRKWKGRVVVSSYSLDEYCWSHQKIVSYKFFCFFLHSSTLSWFFFIFIFSFPITMKSVFKLEDNHSITINCSWNPLNFRKLVKTGFIKKIKHSYLSTNFSVSYVKVVSGLHLVYRFVLCKVYIYFSDFRY